MGHLPAPCRSQPHGRGVVSLGLVWMVMDTGSVEVIQGIPVAWRGEKQRTWRQQDVSWQEGAGAAGPGVRWEEVGGGRRTMGL